ncbi:MAG: DUF58 domain-containing protein [Acidiferrobacterales bacterium]
MRFAGLRRVRARQASVVLGRHKLYMLPTRSGALFAVAVFALLLASVNYQLGLGYLLTFLLACSGVVSMLYTHRNLSGIGVSAAPPAPVFAGERAHFDIWLRNDTGLARFALDIEEGAQRIRINLAQGQSACVAVNAPATRRGYLDCPGFVVATAFPLGLLRSWSRRVELEQRCLIYPQPSDPRLTAPPAQPEGSYDRGRGSGGDDFVGLRPFQPGDSPLRISWKALARGLGPQVKQFGDEGGRRFWIDWQDFAPATIEERLSRMCRAVLDAEAAGLEYGLRLPERVIAAANGPLHRHRALEALALYRA